MPASSLPFNYALLADREKALEWLERAYAERDPSVIYLNVAPDFAFRLALPASGQPPQPQAFPLQTVYPESCEETHLRASRESVVGSANFSREWE